MRTTEAPSDASVGSVGSVDMKLEAVVAAYMVAEQAGGEVPS